MMSLKLNKLIIVYLLVINSVGNVYLNCLFGEGIDAISPKRRFVTYTVYAKPISVIMKQITESNLY